MSCGQNEQFNRVTTHSMHVTEMIDSMRAVRWKIMEILRLLIITAAVDTVE